MGSRPTNFNIARTRAAGHDADTVQQEGLAGATDPDVMKAAVADRRMVFTLDREPERHWPVTWLVSNTPTPSVA